MASTQSSTEGTWQASPHLDQEPKTKTVPQEHHQYNYSNLRTYLKLTNVNTLAHSVQYELYLK